MLRADRMLQYFPTTEAGMRPIPLLGGLMCLAVSAALAQDPVKVDPNHYKVEFENAQVRVLRIHYGAHEKSVMHYHPASVAVFLTDVTENSPIRTESRRKPRGRRENLGGARLANTFPKTPATTLLT